MPAKPHHAAGLEEAPTRQQFVPPPHKSAQRTKAEGDAAYLNQQLWLEENTCAFEDQQSDLKKHHPGKYVIFHEGLLVDMFDNFFDAKDEALRRFDNDYYLIRKIDPPVKRPPVFMLPSIWSAGSDKPKSPSTEPTGIDPQLKLLDDGQLVKLNDSGSVTIYADDFLPRTQAETDAFYAYQEKLLEKNARAYEAQQEELKKHHFGKYVIFHDCKLVDIFDDFFDALTEADHRFGSDPVLVRRIGPDDEDPPNQFTPVSKSAARAWRRANAEFKSKINALRQSNVGPQIQLLCHGQLILYSETSTPKTEAEKDAFYANQKKWLEKTTRAYEAQQEELEKHHFGKYAIFQEYKRVDIFDTLQTTAVAVMRRLDSGPCLIRKIGETNIPQQDTDAAGLQEIAP